MFSAALGQAFFSLSLGMGAMITYGSYLTKAQGIAAAAAWVVVLDTAIALLAGFIIFPSRVLYSRIPTRAPAGPV